ncbi:MAG TPA: DinB family protein [Pelobium sp.]|nr:DinB family protein [Pelobium sp.]
MTNQLLKQNIVKLLKGGNAHADFEAIIKDIPLNDLGKYPQSLPYSIWDLVEHLRIAQWDILMFSKDPQHHSPEWPKGYWVEKHHQPTAEEWQKSVESYKKEQEAFSELIENSDDLLKPLDWGDGQSLLQEALTLADHTAYHLGEILVLRRLLGNWG